MNKKISQQLIELRNSKRISQVELGKKLGMSRSKVSSWEVGRRDISVEDVKIISDFYEVSLDVILHPDGITFNKIISLINEYKKSESFSHKEKLKTIKMLEASVENWKQDLMAIK